MKYRWDQGRLLYFQFRIIREIAIVLSGIEGIKPNESFDTFRKSLESGTNMPFSPSHYKVWRNYKRVFECSMIGTTIDDRFVLSDIGKALANDQFDVDSYIFEIVKRFRYPFPAFVETYDVNRLIYPFCAFIKFIVSFNFNKGINGFKIEDIFQFVIGNNLSGLESIDNYRNLNRTSRSPIGDENRQVREMIMFMGQMSIFKIINRKIYLDVDSKELLSNDEFLQAINPQPVRVDRNIKADFFKITKDVNTEVDLKLDSRLDLYDVVFTEGQKKRVTHLKTERSPLLRKMYFKANPTIECDMCTMKTQKRYPWTNNLLELHHILPLSSALGLDSTGTSLADVVPLCPTCHRATHSYYREWFKSSSYNDFVNKEHAKGIYFQAKLEIKL